MKHNTFAAVLLLTAVVSTPSGGAAESYIDMTIDQAVSVALEHNRDIISAREETVRADFQITEAASAAYPQIHGSWGFDKNLKPQVFVISFPDSTGALVKNRLKVGTDHMMNIGASLTQPIWVGGKVGTALKAAKIYKNMSNETFSTVQQNVVTGVATAFNGILLAQEMVRITKESLSIAEKHLANVESLRRAGSATEYDMLRARVHVANLKPDVIESENAVRIALLRFKNTLGIAPETAVTIKGELTLPDSTLLKNTDARMTLERRPEFKTAQLGVDLQDKAVRIAFGDFLPTLTASSTFAYSGNFDVFRYAAEDWNPYWMASLNLTIPLFTGFKNYSSYKQAKVDYRKAQIDLKRTRDAIVIEVDENEMNLRKAMEQIASQRLTVEDAARAVQLAESLYANGKATQLEVLDAQLALEVARTNYANALFEGKNAEITLKKALGLLDIDNRKGME